LLPADGFVGTAQPKSFYSPRNAVYVCATFAPVAQPDRATDF
jgi:hypothetical protein